MAEFPFLKSLMAPIVFVCYNFLISSVHLHFLAFVNNMWWTWKNRYFLMVQISFPLDVHLGVGVLDHVVVLIFIVWGISILFLKMVVPVYILTNSAQRFFFSTSSATLLIFWLFNDTHSNRREELSHGEFLPTVFINAYQLYRSMSFILAELYTHVTYF